MKTEISINKGKHKIGVPFVSDAYKAKTPRKLKMLGDSLVFVGASISIIASTLTPPGWVVMVGGLAGLAGRFIVKCVGESK